MKKIFLFSILNIAVGTSVVLLFLIIYPLLDNSSNTSLAQLGASCGPLYCYNGPNSKLCQNEGQIKQTQQKIIVLKNEILYYKNRALAERQDLLNETNITLKNKIVYLEKRIEDEKRILRETQDENARTLQRNIISELERQRSELKREKLNKEELAKNLKNLAEAIEKIGPLVDKGSQATDNCLLNGIKSCKASCQGGCHDAQGCFPSSCTGGKPSTCNLQSSYNQISQARVKIEQAVQDVLFTSGEIAAPPPPEIPPPEAPPEIPMPSAGCPPGYKFDGGISKQCQNVSPGLNKLLACMRQKLPAGVGRISSISDSNLFGSTATCRREPTCANNCHYPQNCCSHSHPCEGQSLSCHYGGKGCYQQKQSYAVDFGDEQNDELLKSAAQSCDPNAYIIYEGDHLHISVGNEYGCECN